MITKVYLGTTVLTSLSKQYISYFYPMLSSLILGVNIVVIYSLLILVFVYSTVKTSALIMRDSEKVMLSANFFLRSFIFSLVLSILVFFIDTKKGTKEVASIFSILLILKSRIKSSAYLFCFPSLKY
jgi:hypothetical protein